MKKTVVINVVGLSQRLLGDNTPFLNAWRQGKNTAAIEGVLPAVTCTVQSTYLTGKYPSEHGIVGNGWYFRDECEVKLWRQSNKLVQSEKIWDEARRINPDFTVANMFWWYNMYSTADFSVTPRPQYLADGRKLPDCYSFPATLRDELQEELGTFPLFDFWGPRTSIKSSRWIVDASKYVIDKHEPTLTLVYLPHLDYCLQKYSYDDSRSGKDIAEIDGLLGEFIPWLEARGLDVVLVSEYGITPVNKPIHINRILRRSGFIKVRTERGTELLDPGASKAFAVADHQIAHVYCEPDAINDLKKVLHDIPGIKHMLDKEQQKEFHIDHERSGELVLVAEPEAWFTYYFWLDDKKAPDYARMVDIHKKPGYDPVEMFMDPTDPLVVPKVIGKLAAKKMGFRTVMDVIPLDATLIGGSHGHLAKDDLDKAIFIGDIQTNGNLKAIDLKDLLIRHMQLG